MRVCKEVYLLLSCLFGVSPPVQAFFIPAAAAVDIHIDPVPEAVCAGRALGFEASVVNVEGPATVRITAGPATAVGTGMGAASAKLVVDACQPGLLTVYFDFGEYGSYSSNVVVVTVATVEAVPGGPVCVPTAEPIRYRAYPSDAAGYGLCLPQWAGPNLVVDPQDPWQASAHCDQGGYYYASASLGQDPPCRFSESSVRIMACEVELLPAYAQDVRPPIFPNVCLNAQEEYRRAKYRVVVLPEGTRATVSLAADSVPDVDLVWPVVRNRDTFYVIAGQTTGPYGIHLKHDELPGCETSAEGLVFRFQLLGGPGVNGPNLQRGVGTFNAATGQIASATPDDSAAGHGAVLTRGFDAGVVAEPPGSFVGRVRTSMEVTHTMVPRATIFKNSRADRRTVGLSGGLGMVRVAITATGPHSIATATFNAQVQVGDGAPVEAGNFTYSSDAFVVPLLWYTKDFGGIPVVQTLADVPRLFEVGPGAPGLPVRASIGLLCLRREARGVATVREADATADLEFGVVEDHYEIVP